MKKIIITLITLTHASTIFAPKETEPLLRDFFKITQLIKKYPSEFHEKIKEIVDQNPAIIHQTDNNDNSLLHHAVAFKNLHATRFLIKKGAQLNNVNKKNLTPVQTACINKSYDPLVLLLISNAEIPCKKEIQKNYDNKVYDSKTSYLLAGSYYIDNALYYKNDPYQAILKQYPKNGEHIWKLIKKRYRKPLQEKLIGESLTQGVFDDRYDLKAMQRTDEIKCYYLNTFQ